MSKFFPPIPPIDASQRHKPVTEHELIAEANGERVTLEQVENTILSEHYFTAYDGTLGADVNKFRDSHPTEAARVQPRAIDPAIPSKEWQDLSLITFCLLRLRNGYVVHGTSACADPLNYNEDIGRRIARENAVRQIWPLLGYELKTELSKLYSH